MLEDLIRQRIHFTRNARTGFNHCVCEVCHDHTDRGGFKFDNGTIGYNCFNCGAHGKYTEDSGRLSRNFREILNDFGISDEELDTEIGKSFLKNGGFVEKKITLDVLTNKQEKKNYLVTPETTLPPHSFRLGSTNDHFQIQLEIVEYLDSRKIDAFGYPFYFSLDPEYLGYVIIPFYRNGKLIYWQGRRIKENENLKRYNNCSMSKENIIFNFDELFKNGSSPLFVTEGVFDALCLNGIAIIGSKINTAKLEILKKTKRDLIFVIDKDPNGKNIANIAIENGWKITFTPDGVTDTNNCVNRHGKCYTIFSLFKNIPKTELEAKALSALYCKKRASSR
jgi:hypothetical protein